MKVYNLSCEHGHQFEGWFSSDDDFNQQIQHQHVGCPLCESNVVHKLPSAPRLNLSSSSTTGQFDLKEMQAKYLEAVRQVLSNTEDVGERFAEEARRIHYQEIPERAIRGVATPRECAALADEGIDVLPISIPAVAKQSLQ